MRTGSDSNCNSSGLEPASAALALAEADGGAQVRACDLGASVGGTVTSSPDSLADLAEPSSVRWPLNTNCYNQSQTLRTRDLGWHEHLHRTKNQTEGLLVSIMIVKSPGPLARKLLELFSADELRGFIADLDYSGELLMVIPPASSNLFQCMFDVSSALLRRGRIDDTFFQLLQRTRPYRADDIEALKTLYLGSGSRSRKLTPTIRYSRPMDANEPMLGYTDEGESAPLICVWTWAASILTDRDDADAEHVLASLNAGRRLIVYDRIGVGESRIVPAEKAEPHPLDLKVASLDDHVRHLARLVASCNLANQSFDLVGDLDGASLAAVYAARYPEQVRRLVLWAPFLCGNKLANADAISANAALVEKSWGAGRYMISAMVYGDAAPEKQVQYRRALKQMILPKVAARYIEFQYSLDIRGEVGGVRAPTLVLHRENDPVVPFDCGRAFVQAIANARLNRLKGASTSLYVMPEQFIENTLDFLDSP